MVEEGVGRVEGSPLGGQGARPAEWPLSFLSLICDQVHSLPGAPHNTTGPRHRFPPALGRGLDTGSGSGPRGRKGTGSRTEMLTPGASLGARDSRKAAGLRP